MDIQTATFGAGCFWGVEEAFSKVPGVVETTVGYSGGNSANPTYEQVCSNQTGHVEVTQVKYDPSKVSYQDLLKKFWEIHDPTTLNRQGPDIGEQYRSVVFYNNDEQKQLAEKAKEELDNSGKWSDKIVTAIEPAKEFYQAEDYHQKYFAKKSGDI